MSILFKKAGYFEDTNTNPNTCVLCASTCSTCFDNTSSSLNCLTCNPNTLYLTIVSSNYGTCTFSCTGNISKKLIQLLLYFKINLFYNFFFN